MPYSPDNLPPYDPDEVHQTELEYPPDELKKHDRLRYEWWCRVVEEARAIDITSVEGLLSFAVRHGILSTEQNDIGKISAHGYNLIYKELRACSEDIPF